MSRKFFRKYVACFFLLTVVILSYLVFDNVLKRNVGLITLTRRIDKLLELEEPKVSLERSEKSELEESKVALERSEKSELEEPKMALERSEKVYQSYVEKRREFRNSHPDKVNLFSWSYRVIIWDYLLPAFHCPYGVERVGGLGDGGKWLCGFEQYEKSNSSDPCVVYSFGVGEDSSFEAEFLKRTDCKVFAFDGTVSNMRSNVGVNPRLQFDRILLSNSVEDSLGEFTLGHIMKKNHHTFIDFLKVDVEGAEFRVLSQIMDEFQFLPFGQLSIEVHLQPEKGITLPEVLKFWERLEGKGLRAFRNEANFHPVVEMNQKPWAIEYSFVNVRNSRSKFNLGKWVSG